MALKREGVNVAGKTAVKVAVHAPFFASFLSFSAIPSWVQTLKRA